MCTTIDFLRFPAVSFVVLGILARAPAQYSGGSGTADDPYQIATAADLMLLGESPKDSCKHFVLTANIDLDPNLSGCRVFDKAVIHAFSGVFDGNDRTISHLAITGETYLGLFGQLNKVAEVRNLGLVDVNILGSGYLIGGLVGSNSGSIFTSYSTGTISGQSSVGGLVGGNHGNIFTSYSAGTIGGQGSLGGLVGSNYEHGSITNCHSSGSISATGNSVGGLAGGNAGKIITSYSTGTVSGIEYVGGLVGSNRGSVFHCRSSAVVNGTKWAVGGLVGMNYGNILYCHSDGAVGGSSEVGGLVGHNGWRGNIAASYSSGTVSGMEYVGGLVGSHEGNAIYCHSGGVVSGNSQVGGLVGTNYGGRLLNCYSESPSNGKDSVGGLAGHNEGEVAYCYSTGIVSGTADTGGLVASDDGAVTDCFWDIQSSHQANSAAGTGLTTAQMQTAHAFLAAGWDFVDETANGAEDIWWIAEGVDYPRLVRQLAALSPEPCDGAEKIVQLLRQPIVLGWVAGACALHHDIYLGEDEEAVTKATVQSAEIYRGRQPVERSMYDLGILETSKTYYWRIDEVNEADPNGPWKGNVWSFTTADFIVVDDFESYNDDFDAGGAIFDTWIDGWANGTGSTVGYLDMPFLELAIVHGGRQSMPFFYDNDGTVYEGTNLERSGIPFYSECERTWDMPQNWTIHAADALTLYFHGRVDNAPDHLYVGIKDQAGRIAVVRHPHADALLVEEWQRCDTPLADLHASGVDLGSVEKMYIGLGDRDNPRPGGSGLIYIDDIWVTDRMP